MRPPDTQFVAVIHCDTPLARARLSAERLRDAGVDMAAHRCPEAPAPDISVHVVVYPATSEELVGKLTGKPAKEAAT